MGPKKGASAGAGKSSGGGEKKEAKGGISVKVL